VDVIEWLLDSDPAIRWQVMHDLIDTPEEDIVAAPPRLPPRPGRTGGYHCHPGGDVKAAAL